MKYCPVRLNCPPLLQLSWFHLRHFKFITYYSEKKESCLSDDFMISSSSTAEMLLLKTMPPQNSSETQKWPMSHDDLT